jgi:hydroxyquinol 1,2-dioxygenase
MSRLADALAQADRERSVTEQVVESFAAGEDPRFRLVMESLVRHLHGFIRDVRLTQAEWDASIAFLTRVGDITDERRQEFILLSDVLGASMMTVGVNSPARTEATESTVFGPFFVADAPAFEHGDDLSQGLSGRPCHVHGSVTSATGTPLLGARVEVWAADDEGFYDVQIEGTEFAGRGHLATDSNGEFSFWTVQPAPYPIPHDGPVGDLLTLAGRSPMRPAHIHFMVTADGHEKLITHVFVAGDPWLESDAVFGVKESLILDFVEREPTMQGPHGRALEEPWSEVRFDVVLAED